MYTTIKNFLSKEESRIILDDNLIKHKLEPAKVSGDIVNTNIRKSSVFFVDDISILNQKLKNELLNTIKVKGNTVSGLGPYQFTKYGVGDYYDWHTDSDNNFEYRFCSVVIQLNDDYTGGVLELKKTDDTIYQFEEGTGNLFIFLSNMLHRVTPVETGIRYSLVNWISLEEIITYKKTLI
jgi:PKHD-type hydroxylase